jgi:menaquinone-dependent protoporphyrinogen oxidase
MVLLVAYATRNGSTRDVAEHIASMLRLDGYDVVCSAAAEIDDLEGVDAVILGAPIYTGRWHRDASNFVKRHRDELAEGAFAVFALGPRTLDLHDLNSTRDQLDRALRKLDAPPPATIAVFGGVIDPKKLHFPFNRVRPSDARDWDDIHRWAANLPAALGCGKPADGSRDLRSALPQAPR